MGKLSNLINLVLPKKGPKAPTAFTNTYNPFLNGNLLPIPAYQDHLTDLATARTQYDTRAMLKLLFKADPDVSAAVNAYLTVADTEPVIYVRNLDGSFDLDGHQLVNSLIQNLTTRTDYSKGYQRTTSLRALCEQLRYLVLLRGGLGAELVLDKFLMPSRLNVIDMATIYWIEDEAGIYQPKQRPTTTGQLIDLSGVPTFFTAFYRQDPTTIYTEGTFVSAINTIAARQQVINDLYRIMQMTGYPRLDITVAEDVLMKSAPANIANDSQKRRDWVNARLNDITGAVVGMRADQPFAHTDGIQISIVNDKKPGMAVDISHVIGVLNGQNQAALKTMATIIGRGESGVNTASVEARVFSLNADQLNRPVSDIMSMVLTYCLRLSGSESSVEFDFRPAELRSWSELEPQLTLKQARLLEALSLGLIDDIEFHMEMYGRPPLPDTPLLSGTGFMQPQTSSGASDGPAGDVTPNSDPLGRALQPTGAKTARNMTKSNAVKTKPGGQK